MHEMWVIYDTANQSYLTGGNSRALEYGRAIDPFESHRYYDLTVARKMLKRLNQEIVKADAATESYLLPVWNPRNRDENNVPPYVKYPVKVKPTLCVRRIHSPQIEEVDL